MDTELHNETDILARHKITFFVMTSPSQSFVDASKYINLIFVFAGTSILPYGSVHTPFRAPQYAQNGNGYLVLL